MTRLIHIVGEPGVGKTTLAMAIVADYKLYGKLAVSLSETFYQVDGVENIELVRHQKYCPEGSTEAVLHDAVIIEYHTLPSEIDAQHNDLIIRMELVK